MKFELSNVGYSGKLQDIYPELSNFKITTHKKKWLCSYGIEHTNYEHEIEINTLEELLRLDKAVNYCGLVIGDDYIIIYDGYLE